MPDFDKTVINQDMTGWLRPRTTRRYLHPPAADRMFTLWTEGKILFGENIPGEDLSDYKTIRSCAIWPAYSKYFRQFDFRRARLTVSESGTPIHGLVFDIGGFCVEEEAFCDTSEHPTCFIRFRLKNTVPYEISEKFSFFVRCGLEKDIVYGAPDGYASYLPEIGPFRALPATFYGSDRIIRDGEFFVTADSELPLAYDGETGAFCVQAVLPAGSCADIVFSFGKGEPRVFSYEEEREKTESFWINKLSGIGRLPSEIASDADTVRMLRHLTAQILQCFCRHTGSDRPVLRQGGLQRLIWPWDAMPALEALGRIGDFGSEIEAVLNTYFNEMQLPSGEIRNLGEDWASVTACCLYSLATYCLQKGDAEYWKSYRDRALRAFRWIEQQRGLSEGISGAVAGLMPPLRGNDWQDVFQHWTFTDCLTLSAYRALLRAAKAFGDPAEQEISGAFECYRQVVLAVLKNVKGFEGDEPFRIPLLPAGDDRPLLDLFHPYINHMLPVLQLHELLPASVFERVGAWAQKTGLVENGLHCRMPGKDGNTHIFYTTSPDYDWFFLYLLYGNREKAEEIIASSIRYSMTQEYYMAERYDSGDPYFVPWSPNASASGRLINMMLDLYGAGKTNCY